MSQELSTALPLQRSAPTGRRRLSAVLREHPHRSALAVLVVLWAGSLVVAGLVRLLRPGTSGTAASAVALGADTVVALVLLRSLGVRDCLGQAVPAGRRRPPLVAVLLGLSLAPLALAPLGAGFTRPAATTLALLVPAYLATGFTEETIWRGAVLSLLLGRAVTPVRAALFGSALFGASHLTNVVFRPSAAVVVAQAFGAFCFGVGYAAVRLSGVAVWPLMATHALTDLLPSFSTVPAIPVFVGQDVVLLALGVWLLLRRRGAAVGSAS